jgi:hypothetical protein
MTSKLDNHLLISSPSEITRSGIWAGLDAEYMSAAPPFRFRRSREIDTTANDDLMDLLDGEANDEWQRKNGVQAVRDMLERYWVPTEDATVATIFATADDFIVNYPDATLPADKRGDVPILKYKSDASSDEVDLPANAVIAFARPNGQAAGIYFMLTTQSRISFTKELFLAGPGDYEDAWANKVDGIKRVYEVGTGVRDSSHEFLDLGVGATLERYPFLKEQRVVKNQMREKLKKMIDGETNYLGLQALFGEVQGLNQEIARLKRSTSSLVGYAASRGYRLMENDAPLPQTLKGVEQKPFPAKEGQLVQEKRFVTRWVEEKVTHHKRSRFMRRSKRWTTVQRFNRKAEDVKFRSINSNDSMVTEFIQTELVNKNVVVLQNVASGFQADDGRTLESILLRCELDPGFQEACVLLMPVYKQNLFGEDVIAGYHVIRRPTRGRSIVGLPEFFFEEQIAYKLRWLGMELGELLSSINLLPGEVRDISIKTTRSSLREDELKTNQSFETDSSTSFDTVSSVENEFQRENTSEKSKSWSVKASGSYGGFSAGGSSSGMSKQTARQFAKSLNKLTTQAISKMRKTSRSEVVARELSREEMESVSSSSGQISNPNIGRTLNVNYFAVNNIFVSSTYLDDIGFTYISPFELIDGTDIREVRTFSKEELPEFLNSVQEDMTRMLMLGLHFKPTVGGAGAARNEVQQMAEEKAAEFVKTLEGDFLAAFQDYSTKQAETGVEAENAAVSAFSVKYDGKPVRAIDTAKDKNLQKMIDQLVATGEPIEPDIVISPSAAVYSDATIGATEGLESYAVDMRKLEVEKQLAEIVTQMTTAKVDSKATVQIHHNVSHNKTGADLLTIQIGGSIMPGKWLYRVGAEIIGPVKVVTGTEQYSLTLGDDAPSGAKLDQLPGSLIRDV